MGGFCIINYFKKIKDDNYLIFFIINDEFIIKTFSEINPLFHVIKRIIRYQAKVLFHFFQFIIHFPRNFNKQNKIIFYSISKNNYDSIYPIYEQVKEKSYLLSSDYRLSGKSNTIPMFLPLVASLIFIPFLLVFFFYSDKINKQRIILYLDEILLSTGFRLFTKPYLKWIRPVGIVISHDQSFYGRVLIKIAETNGIPCFFVQHSAVTEAFPSLITSYALLEGKDSLDKYFPNGYNTDKVFLIGSPKFDKYKLDVNKNIKMKSVGICSTSSMEKNQVIKLVMELKNQISNDNIFFRPHPGEMISKKYNDQRVFDGIQFSNSLIENSFNYCKNIDVIIAGNSSILLEAAMLNVYPILWRDSNSITKYNDDPSDKYGFIKNGLAVPCDSISEIIDCLEKVKIKKPDVRTNASLYIKNINTDWDGQSADYAATIIKNNI